MKLKLSLLITFLIFISCKKEEPKLIKKSEFLKTWYDTVRVVPFASRLIINQNYTFEYVGGACTASFKSKGFWKTEKDTIILNSSKTKECYWKHPFGLICTKKEFDKIIKDNKTIKDCAPNGEISYIIFENEKFYIRNDTLIHSKRNKYCPELRTAFSSIKKIPVKTLQ